MSYFVTTKFLLYITKLSHDVYTVTDATIILFLPSISMPPPPPSPPFVLLLLLLMMIHIVCFIRRFGISCNYKVVVVVADHADNDDDEFYFCFCCYNYYYYYC